MKRLPPSIQASLARHCLAALLLASATAELLALERTRITVVATTDVHAHVYPVDYFTNRPTQDGLAKIQTLVLQAKKADPELLLLDCGDTIQGTPLGYHHMRFAPERADPTILAMNQMGYVSMTVGNHEFNFGREYLAKASSEARFPWLSANIVRKSDQKPVFTPYVIKEVKGVRVAILGITTPGIPFWENPDRIADLDFLNPIETAARYVPILRSQERADVVVLAAHMGLEEDLSTAEQPPSLIPHESTCIAIANTVPGIDLILMGHTHRNTPAMVINNTLISQAGRWADRLAQADFYLERAAPDQPWRVVARGATTTAPTEKTEPDATILALVKPDHDATQAWLDGTIGTCATTITGAIAREADSAILDLVHKAQLEAGRADISFAASFNPSSHINAGNVTVRDVYSLYTYENTLAVVEITGRQIKEALEHSASYYLPYQPGRTIAQLANPRVPGYNFDTAEGVDYEIDLRRPVGDRICNLTRNGKPFDLDAKYRVAINSFRKNGGGGFRMFRDAQAVATDSREVRDLILEWIEKHGTVPTEPSNNWRFAPLEN
ncbi:MAG TPA: 5'-nucleotidase C-terminal domain-containing protein [Opitutaceae bacterium]|nr:5'-nucleotidase C-terminal domain-containing protein [Opitutaceae bacterium]